MSQQLTQQDLMDLRKQGYSDQDIADALRDIETEELRNSQYSINQGRMNDPRNSSQQSVFSTVRDDNLIRWQLELNDILERAEHILRGDIPISREGQIIWEKNPHPEDNPLNPYGVAEIMKILSMYINRNTILSDYDRDEINYKVFDFGRRINNLIFMRYEELGMDNEHKRKHYDVLVGQITDLVHSAYKRALMGGERRSLREMISISQSTQTTGMMTPNGSTISTNGGIPPRERGMLNPLRYISGKYH